MIVDALARLAPMTRARKPRDIAAAFVKRNAQHPQLETLIAITMDFVARCAWKDIQTFDMAEQHVLISSPHGLFWLSPSGTIGPEREAPTIVASDLFRLGTGFVEFFASE